MLDLKALLTKILNALKVNYVVAEGTLTSNGNGRYRKWNNGKAEFWWHFNVTGVTTAVWVAPIYYMDSTAYTFQHMWEGVFNGAPYCVMASSNYSQVISVIPLSYNANGILNLRFVTVGAKSGQTAPISVYAQGTWK